MLRPMTAEERKARRYFSRVCSLRANQRQPTVYAVEPKLPAGTPAGRLVLPNQQIAGTLRTSMAPSGTILAKKDAQSISPSLLAAGTCEELAGHVKRFLPDMLSLYGVPGRMNCARWALRALLKDSILPFFSQYPKTLGVIWLPAPLVVSWFGNPGLPPGESQLKVWSHFSHDAIAFGHRQRASDSRPEYVLSTQFLRETPFVTKDAGSTVPPLIVTRRHRLVQDDFGRTVLVPEIAVSRSWWGLEDKWRTFDSLDDSTTTLANSWTVRGCPVLTLVRFLRGGADVEYQQIWLDTSFEGLHRVVDIRMPAPIFWSVIYSLPDSLSQAIAQVQSAL